MAEGMKVADPLCAQERPLPMSLFDNIPNNHNLDGSTDVVYNRREINREGGIMITERTGQ
jgi:hypothetical protein